MALRGPFLRLMRSLQEPVGTHVACPSLRRGRPVAARNHETRQEPRTRTGGRCGGRSGRERPSPSSLRREVFVVRLIRSGLLVLVAVACATALEAAPVRVRFHEGITRGFLSVRTPQGERIGHGELTQKPRGDEVDSRLLLQFKDGSVHDETTVYSQRGVFRLEAYRLVQRGPSFPGAEISFDRKAGRYQAKTRERAGAAEEMASGEFDMPPDLANGMALLMLKNLAPGERATAQLAAFMPKPRLLRMDLHQEGQDRFVFAGDAKQAAPLSRQPGDRRGHRSGRVRHRKEPARPPLLARARVKSPRSSGSRARCS